MFRIRIVFSVCLLLLVWYACSSAGKEDAATALPALPPGVDYPIHRAFAPKPEAVALGRHLFFDRRLSFNQTKSCAGCHAPQFAFTDGYRRSLGATADLHQRNSTPVFNIIFLERLTAADTSLQLPEEQMKNPLFNTKFIELGVKGYEAMILERFRSDAQYKTLFTKAYPKAKEPVNMPNIIHAISAFMRSLISAGSLYDHYKYYGEVNAISASAKRGELLFTEKLHCNTCHTGFNFSGGLPVPALPLSQRLYFNTGLYNVNGAGAYPAADEGLKAFTGRPEDMGKFRVPTLRNLAFTAPYMHDGSLPTLDAVIDMYARGGRLIATGENSGDGAKSPLKDPRITGFRLTPEEKKDLLSFLLCLSDSAFVKEPAVQNPFSGDETKGY